MRLFRILLSSLVLLIAGLSLLLAVLPGRDIAEFSYGQIDNIAHQGGNLESPDATFVAFDTAAKLNVDVLEMDVHLSKDGHLIVIHDARIDRTTNGKGAIRDLSLAEIKQLDAAYWWPYHSNKDIEKQNVPQGMTFPFRGKGMTIPNLDEMFQRYPNHRFVIELKDDTEQLREALLKMIDKYDRWNRVLIASFYQSTLQEVRKTEPRAQTYAAGSEIRLFYILHKLHLEKLYPYDIDAFAIPMTSGGLNLATKQFVDAAHNAGMLVHYWTINTEEDMITLMEIGADGLMTDYPSVLQRLSQGQFQGQSLGQPQGQSLNQ